MSSPKKGARRDDSGADNPRRNGTKHQNRAEVWHANTQVKRKV